MNRLITPFVLGLFLAFLSPVPIFSQGKITVEAADGPTSTTTLKVGDKDSLLSFSADAGAVQPYYTYLWIFGDGTFINDSRDSILTHNYRNALNTKLLNSGSPGADVTVYMTGNYSGGSKPPKRMLSTGDIGRTPSKAHSFLPNGSLAISMAPLPVQPVDVAFDPNLPIRLQFNNTGLLPGDTMAAILSFRQPIKLSPTFPIDGQVFLFYNSQVIKGTPSKSTKVSSLFSNESALPSAPPAIKSGRSVYQQSLLHFLDTDTLGTFGLNPTESDEFNDVLVWNYRNLKEEPSFNEKRNLFAELANDSTMQALFNEASLQGDTLRFLAVMTYLDTFFTGTDQLLSQLPNLSQQQQQALEQSGILGLLGNQYFMEGEGFVSMNPQIQVSKIIGMDEVRTPIVAAHDPNNLSLYGCKCPGTGGKKVVGIITFSNDGGAPASNLEVVLHVPPQLNMNSLEDISMTPNPAQPEFRNGQIDINNRTITWQWPGPLSPAIEAGVGHPSTIGEIIFSLLLKDGTDIGDLEETFACITFNGGEEMCTKPVVNTNIITTTGNDQVNKELECEECKEAKPEPNGCACGPLCMLLVAVGLFVFLVVIWFVKKFLGNN